MTKADQKPRVGRPPIGKGEQVVVRMQPELLDPLDKLVEAKGAKSRAAVIRHLLRGHLKKKGLM